MGTTYSVKVTDSTRTVTRGGQKNLRKDIADLLVELNRQLSVFRPDSEISVFNASREPGWFAVSRGTARVVGHSLWMCRHSGGAFDVTIAPLIELWGFGKNRTRPEEVTAAQVRQALRLTGCGQLEVRLDPPALRKKDGGVTCNLSAIAKGYGVDRIAEYLVGAGFTDFLVEIGGEIRARGRNRSGRYWRIGILAPADITDIYRTVILQDTAIATSGDYRNYFEREGVRYSHTLDPRTGRPIGHSLASVSVIHDSCMNADAFATAINVLGPEEGMALAKKNQLAVLMILRTPEGFADSTTPWFDAIIGNHD